MKIAIIGGGIGGLSVAIGLANAGVDVELFERAPRIEQVGAGIGLALNAQRALAHLRVLDAVRARGNVADEVVQMTSRGEVLARGANQTLWVHRADLQGVLLDDIDPQRIHLDAEFIRCREHERGITAYFKNGEPVECDVLIGADGLRSAVRRTVFGARQPRHTRSIAWRGVTTFPGIADRNTEIFGIGLRFAIFPIGNGRVYWFGGRRAPEGFVLAPGERKQQLASWYRGWAAPIADVIESTPEETIIQTDVYDRKPIARWSKGRVVLLGDSAHPTTPDMGQGCAQVLEDVVAMSQVMGSADIQHAIERYERKRIKRANHVLRSSHRFTRIAYLQNPAACWMRNRLWLNYMNQVCVKHSQASAGTA